MMEGDLTVKDRKKSISNCLRGMKNKMKDWLLWKQMRLAGKTILFEHKKELKKRVAPPARVIWISIASAAAALLLFFSLFRTDQGINPSGLASSEAELQMESLPDQEESASPETTLLSEEGTTPSSAKLASEPVILDSERIGLKILASEPKIEKYQDPRELTGQSNDTSIVFVKEADLHERPLRMARLERGLIKQNLQANFDRIEPLDLPPISGSSAQLFEEDYAEDGLGRSYREFVEEKNISLLSIASAGIKGINRLAGSDLSLNVAEDENGEVRGFRFRSSLLSVDSPVKKQNISR